MHRCRVRVRVGSGSRGEGTLAQRELAGIYTSSLKLYLGFLMETPVNQTTETLSNSQN